MKVVTTKTVILSAEEAEEIIRSTVRTYADGLQTIALEQGNITDMVWTMSTEEEYDA